jgi:intracellular multiplication protein IcmB
MYMLGRHVLGSRFFLMPEDVRLMPELYQAHHRREIESIRLSPKRLCYDELHRVTSEKGVSDQLVSDLTTSARESRKWNLSIGLYSQSLADFPKTILELSTSVFILGAGTQESARELSATFGLSESLTHALTRIGKPQADGASMLAIFKTQDGSSKVALKNTLSPLLLWAFSTTTEDAAAREALYRLADAQTVLRFLAGRYPNGLKAEKERRARNLEGEAECGVMAEFIRELERDLLEDLRRGSG